MSFGDQDARVVLRDLVEVALADELDAEALRNSVGLELFTNPAKKQTEDYITGRYG